MDVPLAGLFTEEGHLKLIDASLFSEERANSGLPIDRSVLHGKHRTRNDRNDRGKIRGF
jgi:hypothetical protein